MTRVLRVYHSGVVPNFRLRDELLRSAHGHDVRLVVPPRWDEGGRLVEADRPADDVMVIPTRGPRHPILFWYAVRAFRRCLREFRPDIVDIHEEPYSLAVAAALWCIGRECPGVPVCIYSAQNIQKRYPPPFNIFERRALARTAAAYPCSSEVASVLRAKGFGGDIRVIPLGVTITDRPRRSFNREPLIGFVGRLEPYKGADIAVRAFAAACASVPGARLQIVGEGSEREALATLARDTGVADQTSFTGALPQATALDHIARFDVLLVPSRTTSTWKEQFGRIVAEAFEAGTPVIASDSGSLREVVGDAGVLVPEDDVAGFATALTSVISDHDRQEALSARGRERAAAEYSWERVAADFDDMYSRVLSAEPPSTKR